MNYNPSLKSTKTQALQLNYFWKGFAALHGRGLSSLRHPPSGWWRRDGFSRLIRRPRKNCQHLRTLGLTLVKPQVLLALSRTVS